MLEPVFSGFKDVLCTMNGLNALVISRSYESSYVLEQHICVVPA